MDGKVVIAWAFEGCDSPRSPSPSLDGDMDFLDEAAGSAPTAPERSQDHTARRAAADRFAVALAADPVLAQSVWTTATRDPRLAHVDGDALWVLCAAAGATSASDSAALARAEAIVAGRAMTARDSELAWAGAQLAIQGAQSALQAAVAETLDLHLAAWGRERRVEVLDFLHSRGDGRCVRPVEALLARQGHLLDDVQAYKARHLVQVIRRGRRK